MKRKVCNLSHSLQSCQRKFPKMGFLCVFFANYFYWCVVWSLIFTDAKH
eukprot:UN01872